MTGAGRSLTCRCARSSLLSVTASARFAPLWHVATRGITVEEAVGRARITGDRSVGRAALSLISIR